MRNPSRSICFSYIDPGTLNGHRALKGEEALHARMVTGHTQYGKMGDFSTAWRDQVICPQSFVH